MDAPRPNIYIFRCNQPDGCGHETKSGVFEFRGRMEVEGCHPVCPLCGATGRITVDDLYEVESFLKTL